MRTQVPGVISYPATPKGVQFVGGLVGMQYGMSLAARIKGLFSLLQAVIAPGRFAKSA
jgi:hypothetical protein